jgi:uracil-DNA glycosylase
VRSLLRDLQHFEAEHVFNPWRHTDPLDVVNAAPKARCERLRAHFDCEPRLLLVGEAPGYQGCHFSGIPFTNEKLILQGVIPRVRADRRLTSRERPWCEPSATIVWGILHELKLAERTILWNTFAWHPHKPGNPLSNRTPSRGELEAGLAVLRRVLGHFSGVRVVPVGQIAAKTLASLGVRTLPAVRHPAMGGATAFRAGLRALAAT